MIKYLAESFSNLSKIFLDYSDRLKLCSEYRDIERIIEKSKNGEINTEDKNKFYRAKSRIRLLDIKGLKDFNSALIEYKRKGNQINKACPERRNYFFALGNELLNS